MLYDEAEVIAQIKALPLNVRMHLQHVMRNGLMVITSACVCNGDIENAIKQAEKRLKEIGL